MNNLTISRVFIRREFWGILRETDLQIIFLFPTTIQKITIPPPTHHTHGSIFSLPSLCLQIFRCVFPSNCGLSLSCCDICCSQPITLGCVVPITLDQQNINALHLPKRYSICVFRTRNSKGYLFINELIDTI